MPCRKAAKGPAVLCDLDEVRAWAAERGYGTPGPPTGVQRALAEAQAGEADAAPLCSSRASAENKATLAIHLGDPDKPPSGVKGVAKAVGLSQVDVESIAAMLDNLDGTAGSVLALANKIPPPMLARVAALGKARKDTAEADKRELEVQQKRGELVSRVDQDAVETARMRHVKLSLEALGAKLGARLQGITGPRAIARVVDSEVQALLMAYYEGRDYRG